MDCDWLLRGRLAAILDECYCGVRPPLGSHEEEVFAFGVRLGNHTHQEVACLKVWYELGHLDIIRRLEDAEKTTPGLYVCGNYKSGVAFPDCVTFGYDHAKEVAAFLASK